MNGNSGLKYKAAKFLIKHRQPTVLCVVVMNLYTAKMSTTGECQPALKWKQYYSDVESESHRHQPSPPRPPHKK
eukprot:scaffold27601_cov69-Cyclotella_meneghiniana.AAC.14